MAWSLYNGQIVDRIDPVLTEGNKSLLTEIVDGKNAIQMLIDAIVNNEIVSCDGGRLFMCGPGGYWVEIKADGSIEIGESAA